MSSAAPGFTLAVAKASIDAAELSVIMARRMRPDLVSRYLALFQFSILDQSLPFLSQQFTHIVSIDAAHTEFALTFFVERLGSAVETQNDLFDPVYRHVAAAGARFASPQNTPCRHV